MGLRILAAVCVAGCGFHAGSSSPDAGRGDALIADAAARDSVVRDSVVRDSIVLDSAPIGPALVQQQTNYAASGSTLTATLASPPTSGNTLVMIGAANSGALGAVTGGGVATWTLGAASASHANIEIWFGVTDGSSSVVTIQRTGNPYSIWMSVTEWTGLATSNLLDVGHAAAGTAATANAGTITTTHANDLVFFAAADENPGNAFGAPGPGGWNGLTNVGGGTITQSEWYVVASATGSFAPQVSDTGHSWDAAIVALRIAP